MKQRREAIRAMGQRMTAISSGAGRRRWRRVRSLTNVLAVLAMLGLVLAVEVHSAPVASAAPTRNLSLSVVSAATGTSVAKGAPITTFKYLINEDNTGQNTQRSAAPGSGCSPQDAGYPGSCSWTSMGIASSSPVVATGDQTDIAAALAALGDGNHDGRYLVSVLADGFKLDGAHFTIPMDSASATAAVKVEMMPTDPGLPAATIQTAVFEDNASTNGAPDLPAEHGLAGFKGQVADYLGLVTTDIFGSPLCTTYNADGSVAITGGTCLSKCYVVDNGLDIGTVAPRRTAETWTDGVTNGPCAANDGLGTQPMTNNDGSAGTVPAGAAIEGKIKIPNLGPNRYALSVVPPDGSGFVQTTTLEGDHDWDAWVMEGATGLDTEFVQAGEPFPAIIFGFVHPTCNQPHVANNCDNTAPMAAGTGSISGVIDAVKVYYPPKGGVSQVGQIFGGLQGAKVDKPIPDGWVSLTDLNNGDVSVWTGKAGADGKFTISGVPAGSYSITWFDEAQTHILDLQNVTVAPAENVDLGILPLNGWWTNISGYVFNDLNRNGVREPGEAGIPNFTLTVRRRDNSLMDRGGTVVTTDATGKYEIRNAYPMTQWLVLEAYDDRFYTTGVTYQPDNAQPKTHLADRAVAGDPNSTFLGTGVDVSFLPIIGLAGTIDFGVHNYDPLGVNGGKDPRNGGIVGTVSYDTTRNELDPRYAAVEDWQPGVAGVDVNLYAPVYCGTNSGAACDADGLYELAADGSYKHGDLLNTYVTETWEQPTGCTARDIDGAALVHGVDEKVLPLAADAPCLEGPLMGVQFQDGFSNVDGNYGFTTGCQDGSPYNPDTELCVDGTEPTPLLSPNDYIVEPVSPTDVTGKSIYKVTREEDINIANGDPFVPQVPPPACAGPLHKVDVAGILPDGPNATVNPTFVDIGGSPYEGQIRPLCTQKLVSLNSGKSIVPTFNWFTDVNLPGRFWGLVVDDLQFSGDPTSLMFGEKQGVAFAPVGIYDYTDRLVYTTESDNNGLFDVLMPSTNRISCPTPSGVCANLYRFVGNDPGTPGRLNLNYKPGYRTIAAEFEAWPGLIVPADLAPTQVGVNVQLPGGQITAVACAVDAGRPQLYRVSRPFALVSDNNAQRTITINGDSFGTATGTVTLGSTSITPISWTNTTITFRVPNGAAGTALAGRQQLSVTAANGLSTLNGITFHVLGGTYNPNVIEVGPATSPSRNPIPNRYRPKTVTQTLMANPPVADHAIQTAIDDAASTASQAPDLIVVYPGVTDPNPRYNPRGAYFENLVVTKSVSIQGVGPGDPSGAIAGTIVDGSAFAGDSPVATDWTTKVAGLQAAGWLGNQTVNDGAVFTLYAPAASTYSQSRPPAIDGIDIRGADQQGFPNNLNAIGGGTNGLPAGIVTQGGAVFANAYVDYLQITNDVVENNGGGYGTIRIGTPELTGDRSSHNDHVRIANNRIIHNAGTNLAGGIGLFYGSDSYEVANNDICGNFSAEYGGGVSVYGSSPDGSIHDNKIRFNQSYDEGAGIMIAGELPTNPLSLSTGSGAVDIYRNVVEANLSNDDGGGIRVLMAGNFPMNVYDNMVVNNVSAHEGGGIALDDAPNVRFYNNTVMKNITTATAVTSDGQPAPAGLSTGTNSVALQATLPVGSPTFSDPLLFNDVFWDNRAGTRNAGSVTGIGAPGDATPINRWDMGAASLGIALTPTNSMLQGTQGTIASPTNQVGVDPAVKTPYDVGLDFNVWRNNPQFIGAILVVAAQNPTVGDYHLTATSLAINAGAASKAVPSYQQAPGTLPAPPTDIDQQGRSGAVDIGADEFIAVPVAVASVTPTALAFGNVFVGSTSPAQTVVLSNTGTAVLTGITVVPTGQFARSGGTCGATLNAGATCTITATFNPTAAGAATGTLTITASVPVTGSPVALTGTGVAVPIRPTLPLLDNFNRANAGNLNTGAPPGVSWSATTAFLTVIRVNGNQANCAVLGNCVTGTALWNGTTNLFGAKQGAAFTITATPLSTRLLLKASGGTPSAPTSFIRVSYNGTQAVVETTTNGGTSYTSQGAFATSFSATDVMTAVANADGSVDVWKTSGATTTFLGRSAAAAAFAGTGRIGMQLALLASVDNFAGGTLP